MATKKFKYRCPKCAGDIIWSHNNSRPGSSNKTRCSRNPTSSVIGWNPKNAKFCFWNGVVKRRSDGGVDLFHSDGVKRLRKHFY